MNHRRIRKFVLFGLTLLALILLLTSIFSPAGSVPSFEGESIDYWIGELYLGRHHSRISAPPNSKPRQAIRFFDKEAVPYLLRELDHQDNSASRFIQNLQRKHHFNLPPPLAKLTQPAVVHHLRAVDGFACLGSEAATAIPTLATYLETPTWHRVANALAFIGPKSIPTLFRALSHSDPTIRSAAAFSIQLLSPGADPLVTELLNQLGLNYNQNNSWAHRSVFQLTAKNRVQDCYEMPSYPELGTVIKTIPPNQIAAAVTSVLADLDVRTIISSETHQSTLVLHKLIEDSEPFINGTLSAQETDTFLERLDKASLTYPKRHYSFEMLRLEILLAQERVEDVAPIIKYLQQNAGDNKLRWRDLAFVIVRSPLDPNLRNAYGIEAAENAISLSDPLNYKLIKLAIAAYGPSLDSPKENGT